MKSQDIVLLLKLASLYQQEIRSLDELLGEEERVVSWEGWEIDEEDCAFRRDPNLLVPAAFATRYTARGLEKETGIGKSEVKQVH